MRSWDNYWSSILYTIKRQEISRSNYICVHWIIIDILFYIPWSVKKSHDRAICVHGIIIDFLFYILWSVNESHDQAICVHGIIIDLLFYILWRVKKSHDRTICALIKWSLMFFAVYHTALINRIIELYAFIG